MSTHVESIVDLEATVEEAPELARRVVADLLARRVILANPRHDSLSGDQLLYTPGPNVAFAAEHSRRSDCRMEVQVGRMIYDAGENGLDSIACPTCGHALDLDGDEWAAAIREWSNIQGPGHLTCVACGNLASVTSWRFTPTIGFGDLAFSFTEWLLHESFVEHVARLLGHRIAWVRAYY